MKKKVLTVLLALVAALCLCFGLAACGGFKTAGTYYLFEDDEYDMDTYFTLKNGKWTDQSGASGEYEIDGEKITFYSNLFGQKMEMVSGTIKNGILTMGGIFDDAVYAQKGAAHIHEYGEWVTQTPSTCTEHGTEVLICKTCGKYQSRSLPLAPHPYGEWEDIIPATCTTGGQHKHICTVCSHEESEPSQPLGHEYTVENKCVRYEQCGVAWEYTDGLAFALDEKTGTFTVTGIGSASGDIVIPYGYAGKWVTSIGYDAFYGCSGLESVTIGSGVTSIGNNAFDFCSRLENITVDEGNQNYSSQDGILYNKAKTEIIGVPMGIKGAITIPDSVTSIGELMFLHCNGLESVTIGSGVTSIGSSAFSGCNGLESVTIGSGVISIGQYAFEDCDGLESITVDEGNQNYSSQDGILYNKEKTEIIEVPMGIKGAITIPDSVTSIGGYAFTDCSGLESVTIGSGVTSIGSSAFSGCSGLESVTIGSGVTSIGSSAFSGCSGLTSVTIPDSVTSIGSYAFYGCSRLTVYITDLAAWCNIDFGYKEANPLYYAHHLYLDGKEVKELIIPKGVTEIKAYAFYNCDGLTSVTIGSGVTSIEYAAFRGCSGLKSVTIGSGVTSIGSDAFRGCDGLTSITIPNSVTSIGSGAFYNTAYYNDASHWDSDGVLYIGNHLIKAKDTTTGEYSIRTGTKTIGECAFYGCSGLTSITIPDSVTKIEYEAFYGCSGLESVTIGSGVTSIGSYAFFGCDGLTNITIPDNVTSIGDCAFEDCRGLTEIQFKGTVEAWKAIVKRNSWDYGTPDYTITCTDGTVDKKGNVTYFEN